jgi:arylamine N-acetyltransferase
MSTAAYLARIGVAATTPDLATLRAIVAGHTRSIAFENLDPFTGRDVDLDPAALTAKIVHGRRGGYCFEHTLLLQAALDELGYRTTALTGRVVWGRPADAPPLPRTHMVLRVDLPDGPHLVDVGFGGQTLTGVLALAPDVEQPTPHEPYRLLEDAGRWTLQALVGGAWRSLHHFDLSPQERVDLEMASWYVSHHPASHFVTGLVAARTEEGRRHNLGGRILSTHHLDAPSDIRALTSPAEIMTALEETFLLDLSGVPDLEKALGTLF